MKHDVKTGCGFAVFGTPIGVCGVGWTVRGIACVQLPEASVDDTLRRLQRRLPQACRSELPPAVHGAIAGIQALLRGAAPDLSVIALDLQPVPEFHRRVYAVARTIPPGETVTYGTVAARLGAPGAARAVGQALGRNPFPIVVPCHRVVAAGGKPGGFSAHGGLATKQRLRALEVTP